MELNGYKVTLDCLNKPESWQTLGMINDVKAYIREGLDVPDGQLLAMLDWMTWRIQEARDVIVDLPSSPESETLLRKLKGW